MNMLRIRLAVVAIARVGLLVPSMVFAQDLDRLLPDPVVSQVEVPPEKSAATVAGTAGPTLGAWPNEEQLVPELIQLVFSRTPDLIPPTKPVKSGEYQLDVSQIPTLSQESFSVLASYFVGQPVSRESIGRLTNAVRIYLQTANKPFSVVYTPEQDITLGRIQIVVLESEFDGEITIEGNHHFSKEQYFAQIRPQRGGGIDRAQIDEDLAWINRNPFRAATIEAAPGLEPGTTKMKLRVREQFPVRVFVGANNTGTETTQIERLNLGLNWGNVFGKGHQLTAQWTSSWDFQALRSVSGSYAVDLPWRHSLSFSGAYSRTDGIVAQPFALNGESWQIGANYDIPLKSARDGYTHSLRLGVDFKSSDNNFTFSDVPISDNLTHVAQARATYSGSILTAAGSTTFGATLTAAPGGLTRRNKDQFFDVSRFGSKASYVYFKAHASHRVGLDGIKPGLAWTVRTQFQYAPENLIGSEQFGGGGSTTVRGYEEGEIYKDNGVLLSHELRLPPFAPKLGRGPLTDQLQLYLFHDYASLWSARKLAGEGNVDLHSAGVGVDYYMGRHASLRAAYGWQFTDSGSSDSGDNSRLHLSANLSF